MACSRFVLIGIVGLGAMLAIAADAIAAEGPSPALPPLAVPPGFVVEPIAVPPLVQAPTHACFDDQGRMYVCESFGLNVQRDELLETLPRAVLRLEDVDGDGRFDHRTVFADKLTFAMGATWLNGALYVVAPPNVWRLEDTDDDGIADRRDIIVKGFKWSGRSSSVKGPFLGPEGRLYIPGGYEGYELSSPNGKKTISSQGRKAPGVFTCRPDGSDLETFANGAAGAYGLTFSEVGEVFGVNTLMRSPRGDGLVHWVYGGVYPTTLEHPIDVKRTGELMPILQEWGQTSPASCQWYRGEQFGDQFTNSVFSAQFNSHKITATHLTPRGSGFDARDEDFLTSTSPDFHPTDVLQDADGSLIVVDTGGWFVMACPNSRIAKPEITGGIYRVRRQASRPIKDPRGRKLEWTSASVDQMIRRFDDARFAVRDRAVQAVARRGPTAIRSLAASLAESQSDTTRRHCVWALARFDQPQARDALRLALDDPHESVRHAAARVAIWIRDPRAVQQLIKLVGTDRPAIRRWSAAALGRIRDPQAVPALLDELKITHDRYLEHALIYALIEINDARAIAKGLETENPSVRRAALVALDQLDRADVLNHDVILPLLQSDDVPLLKSALRIVAKREAWTDHLTELFRLWIAQDDLPEHRADLLRDLLVRVRKRPAVEQFVARQLAREQLPLNSRLVLLDVIASCRPDDLPQSWLDRLKVEVQADPPEIALAAIATVRQIQTRALDSTLRAVAIKEDRPDQVRVDAAAIADWEEQVLPDDLFGLLIRRCQPDIEPMSRMAAARALDAATLTRHQRHMLLPLIRAAGPLELPTLLSAFVRPLDDDTALKLLSAVGQSPGRSRLSKSHLTSLLEGTSKLVQEVAVPLLKELQGADPQQMEQRMAQLEPALQGGDVERGRRIFLGQRASCAACHRVGSAGRPLGPDLSRIGQIRSRRDLLESIVFPSATIVIGFEPHVIETVDGKMIAGLIRRRTPDAIHLRTEDLAERWIARSEIDQMLQSTISMMPGGFDRLLNVDELRDLVAFLHSLK